MVSFVVVCHQSFEKVTDVGQYAETICSNHWIMNQTINIQQRTGYIVYDAERIYPGRMVIVSWCQFVQ